MSVRYDFQRGAASRTPRTCCHNIVSDCPVADGCAAEKHHLVFWSCQLAHLSGLDENRCFLGIPNS